MCCVIVFFQELVGVLLEDCVSGELSHAYRTNLEIEAAERSTSAVATTTEDADSSGPPSSKRLKSDQSDHSGDVLLHERLCVCNALRSVVAGELVQHRFWSMLSRRGEGVLGFIAQVRASVSPCKQAQDLQPDIYYAFIHD